MKEYIVGIFPDIDWNIQSRINSVPDENQAELKTAARYDSETGTANVFLSAFGIAVEMSAKGEGSTENHAMGFVLERARAVMTAITGREMPFMATMPREHYEMIKSAGRPPENKQAEQEPVKDEDAPAEEGKSPDDPLPALQ
jgi:hypothetical protein